jgi:hypothetical protein
VRSNRSVATDSVCWTREIFSAAPESGSPRGGELFSLTSLSGSFR